MKKILFLLPFLLMINMSASFSQVQKDESKTQVKPALLVIDIQNVYLKMVPEREKEIAMYYINALIELFRSNGYPIIRIYHYDKENGPDQEAKEFQFPESVLVKPDDAKIIKTYGDGFNKTDLDKVLKEKGVNTLFLCGLSAVGCVLSTWIGAQNHDYKAFLIKNAIMSHNSDYTQQIEKIFDAVSYDIVKLILENSGKK
jgi:nicotinamidase-related amidase